MSTRRFFRADQVGSLLRPQVVRDARAAKASGEIDLADLRMVEDAAIAAAIAKQLEIGLPVVVDGEFRREVFWIDFIAGIEGLVIASRQEEAGFSPAVSGTAQYLPKGTRAIGKIRHTEVQLGDDYRFLSSQIEESSSADAVAKITLPSPTRAHVLSGPDSVDPDVYPDMDDYWNDLTEVYRAEIAGLEALGCRYIQIDEPYFSSFIDEGQRANLVHIHGDTDALLSHYVEVINDCIRDRRADTTVALHICRGNARSTWFASGGYDAIAETVFSGIRADALLLEYDDERSGDFTSLAHVAEGVQVVLGLITTKTGQLEQADALKQRVAEAAAVVDMGLLAVSPQCGFASVAEGNLLSDEEQWAKLALVVQTANDLWG